MNAMQPEEILHVAFNQDSSCFVLGTDSGFRVFNSYPLVYSYRRDFPGGIGIVEMIYRSNLLALVGGGRIPYSPTSRILLWDDRQMVSVQELDLDDSILGIRLRRDHMIATTSTSIYIVGVPDMLALLSVRIGPSLCTLSMDPHPFVLAYPSPETGEVAVVHGVLNPPQVFSAHNSGIACLAVNREGTLLATASVKGTLVRVFDTRTLEQMHEVRRGVERALITCLAVHPVSSSLVCLSEKGTLHVFGLGSNAHMNRSSSLKVLSRVLPTYFSSSWSFAQFKIKEMGGICAFMADGEHIVILSAEGTYYALNLECHLETHTRVLELIHW